MLNLYKQKTQKKKVIYKKKFDFYLTFFLLDNKSY